MCSENDGTLCLEVDCPECGGAGEGPTTQDWQFCQRCQGRGRIPSPLGEVILRFVATYVESDAGERSVGL